MIGPPDVTAAATNLQSHSTSNVSNVAQAAALAAVSGDLDAVAEMRDAFARRGTHDVRAALEDPGRQRASQPRRRVLLLPVVRGRARTRDRAAARRRTRSSCASSCSTSAKVAIVPGEAFGAPGYARLSFALGDDDLGEGVRRIADLL